MKRREKPPQEMRTPSGPVRIGDLVRYYHDGWYHGHLDRINGASVRIRPIGPKYGAAPRAVAVPAGDVMAVLGKE